MSELLEVILRELLVLIVLGSLIPLGLTSFVALGLAVLQAATQIQEQTSVYLSKALCISAYLYFLGPMLAHRFKEFFSAVAEVIVRIGRS